MGEALRRVAEELGSHQIIGAGSLADVTDDGRSRPDHISAVFELIDEASRSTSVAGWWQTSPIDGYHWGAASRPARPHRRPAPGDPGRRHLPGHCAPR